MNNFGMEGVPAGEGSVEKSSVEGIVDKVLEEAHLGETKTPGFIEAARRSLLTKTNEQDIKAHLDALLAFAEKGPGRSGALGEKAPQQSAPSEKAQFETEKVVLFEDQGLEDRVIDLLTHGENPEGTPEETEELTQEIAKRLMEIVGGEKANDEKFKQVAYTTIADELKKLRLEGANVATIQHKLIDTVKKLAAF